MMKIQRAKPAATGMLSLVFLLLSFAPLEGLRAQDESRCEAFRSVFEGFSPPKLKTMPLARHSAGYELSWLDRIVASKQVVLIGENHWMRHIRELEQDILFYLNEKHGFRLLILELPYSATAYLNAYLNCRTDSCEKLLPYVRPFFDTKEEIAQLDRLRNWNATHPGREISVACSDIEQDISYTLRYIFIPFFNQLGDKELLPLIRKEGRLTDGIMAYMDSVLRAAPASTVLADRPFIDRDYALKVFLNMDAYYRGSVKMEQMGGENGYPEFWKIRIQRMKENLSDKAIFGSMLQQHKAVLIGGAAHTRIYSPPAGELPDGEGWFLANEYAPTRGRVASIKIVNFGFEVPAAYYSNTNYQNGTQQFSSLVEGYKACFPDGPKGQFLLLSGWTTLSKTLAGRMGNNGGNPIRLQGRAQMEKILKKSPTLREDEAWKDYFAYDWVIAFPGDRLFEY